MGVRPLLHSFTGCSIALICCGATAAKAQAFQSAFYAPSPSYVEPSIAQPEGLAIPPPPNGDAQDMAMPDDMGAPLGPAASFASSQRTGSRLLSVNSPIGQIAATPQGRAVLERDLPGLCERPEYTMFRTMSLARLARMSSGRITTAKLNVVQADLVRVNLEVGR